MRFVFNPFYANAGCYVDANLFIHHVCIKRGRLANWSKKGRERRARARHRHRRNVPPAFSVKQRLCDQPPSPAHRDSIKIPSMSNVAADSGIRRGIRRIKPYVLSRAAVANHGLVNYSKLDVRKYGRVKYPLIASNSRGPERRDVYKTPGIFAVKQCQPRATSGRPRAPVTFYYAITYRNVPANGHKSR